MFQTDDRHVNGVEEERPRSGSGGAIGAGSLASVPEPPGAAPEPSRVHQPTATINHCGSPCETNDDWSATSSYGKP